LLQDKQKNTGPLDKFLLSFFIQQYGEEAVVRQPARSRYLRSAHYEILMVAAR
jgi:hypothetical protein